MCPPIAPRTSRSNAVALPAASAVSCSPYTGRRGVVVTPHHTTREVVVVVSNAVVAYEYAIVLPYLAMTFRVRNGGSS